MTNLNKMYDGVANSPDTFLTSPLASGGNIMYVADSGVFGTLPNLAVLGSGANAETVLILSKRSDQGLNIQRAVEGVARDWVKASIVARNFTNYDYKQLKENIEKINNGKQESLTAGSNIQITNGRISATDTKYNDTQIKKDIAELQNSQLSKASQTEAESGVDNTKYMTPQATKQAIEKLSPKQDLSDYAMKTDIKTKLSDLIDDSTHRVVTDKEKSTWNTVSDKVDKIDGKSLSTNDYTDLAKQKVDAIPANPKYTDTTYSNATTSSAGLMSASDKKKLDGLVFEHFNQHNKDNSGGANFLKFDRICLASIWVNLKNESGLSRQEVVKIPDSCKPVNFEFFGNARTSNGNNHTLSIYDNTIHVETNGQTIHEILRGSIIFITES